MNSRSVTRATLRWPAAVALALLLAPPIAAQPTNPTKRPNSTNPTNPNPTNPTPNPANSTNATDPIECWWKTDRSAVRVGEHFMLTLTCAVLDTERIRVVVDESGLAPSALHLVPFDIVDGRRFRDIQNAPRRFFQHQYTMRVLGEEFFGKEITLPRLQLTYRVQNSLQGGSALAVREAQYSLNPVPIRVLSLVPAGAGEIRDTPAESFGDVERRLFQSNVLLIVAGVAFVLAVLMAALLLLRTAVKRGALVSARHRPVPSRVVLRAASQELAAVRAASQRQGWNSELAGRAASALRLAGAVALSREVGQKDVSRDVVPGEGQVSASHGFRNLRGRKVMLSAATTPATAVTNGATGAVPHWQALSDALARFSAARYRRPTAASAGSSDGDGAALDAALADAQDAVGRLRRSQWRRLRRRGSPVESETARPTWAR